MLKFAIKIITPIRFERIRNGEKVIVQTGPTEYEVEVSGEPEYFQSRGSQTARPKNHRAEALPELEWGAKSTKRTRTRSRRAKGADGSKKPPL